MNRTKTKTATEDKDKDTPRHCENCNKVIDSSDLRRRYCNEECRNKAQQQQLAELTKRRRQVTCPKCETVIVLVPEDKRRGLKTKETAQKKLEMKKQHLEQKRQEMEKLQRECEEMTAKLAEDAEQPQRLEQPTEQRAE
jgi:hypothetical protein